MAKRTDLKSYWIHPLPLPPIVVNGHRFQTPAALGKYINSLNPGREQFAAEQQDLEYYAIYAGSVVEHGCAFADKVFKKRRVI